MDYEQLNGDRLPPKTIKEEHLIPGTLGVTPFASSIRPVQILAALPALPDPLFPQGSVVFLTTDNKLYRSTGTAWTTVVPAVDITGQILAGQIADASLTMAKFAATIRPPRVLGTLPTLPDASYPAGDMVLLTTDSKLYRNVANVWVKSVDGADIIANSIVAGKIAAGAIGTDELAAGSVVASKLLITNFQNLAQDPGFEKHALADTTWTVATGWTIGTSNTRQSSARAAAFTGTSGALRNGLVVECVPGDQFRISGWLKGVSSANGSAYARVSWRDAAGVEFAFGVGTTATSVSAYVESTAAVTAPALAAFACAEFVVVGRTTGTWYADDLFLSRLTGGTIIADGAITTNKIAALAITAGEIAANTITADQIAANTLTAGVIAAGAITASEIAAGAVTAGALAIGDFTNLVADPGFERNDGQWSGSGYTNVTTAPHSGARHGAIPATANVALANSLFADVTEGEKFYLSGWIRSTSGAIGSGSVRFFFYDEAKTYLGNYISAVVAPTLTWTFRDLAVTVPAGASYARFCFYKDGTNGAGTWYYDDAFMVRQSSSTMIEDGAITTAKIYADAITADKILAGEIETAHMTVGTIDGDRISANSLNATKIEALTITAAQITAGTITSNEIATGSLHVGLFGSEAGNLCPNGSFEQDIATGVYGEDVKGWNVYGVSTRALTTGQKTIGSQSLKMKQTTAGVASNCGSDSIPINPRKRIFFSAWLRGDATNTDTNGTMTVFLTYTNRAGTYLGSSTGVTGAAVSSGTAWVQLSGTASPFASFPTAAYCQIRVQMNSSWGTLNDVVYIDDVVVRYADNEMDAAAGTVKINSGGVTITGGSLAVQNDYVDKLYTTGEKIITTSSAADDIIDTTTSHGYVADDAVRFTALTGGAGLVVDTVYYVSATSLTATGFRVAMTAGGAAIGFTTNITAGTVAKDGGGDPLAVDSSGGYTVIDGTAKMLGIIGEGTYSNTTLTLRENVQVELSGLGLYTSVPHWVAYFSEGTSSANAKVGPSHSLPLDGVGADSKRYAAASDGGATGAPFIALKRWSEFAVWINGSPGYVQADFDMVSMASANFYFHYFIMRELIV